MTHADERVEEIVLKASERADYFRSDAKVIPVASVVFLLTTYGAECEAKGREEEREKMKDVLCRMQRCNVDSLKYFISQEWKKLQALTTQSEDNHKEV